MSTLIVGGILLIFCVVAPIALHLYKRYQDAQMEKMRRVAQLTHAYRLTQRFLHQIPNQYLTRESKLLLLERAICFLGKLKKEIPGSQLVSAKMLRNQTMLDELKKNFIRPAPSAISTAGDARDAQIHLSEFSRFVEIQARVNAIGQDVANEVINQVNWFAVQCLTDFYRIQGENASKAREYRLAIHHFNNEMNEFNKHLEFEKAELGVQECLKLIEQNEQFLEAQDAGEDAGIGTESVEVFDENVLLMKDWETLDNEDEHFKKKQLYG